MNFFKNKFLIGVFVLFITIYFLSAPIARAEDALSFLTGGASDLINATIDVLSGSISVFPMLFAIGDPTAFIICSTSTVFCPNGSGGLALAPVATGSSASGACVYGIPTTFYDWQMNTAYGYADFNYYNGTYDSEGTALSVSAGSSPHYSNSACTNVMPNPYSPASPITYAQVPGVGCVAIYPQGYPQSFPYTYDSNQQVKIYRYTLPAPSDQATLNTWFLSTIRANGGTGWETSSGDIPTFLSDPSDAGLDYYLNSPEPTPLATVPFSTLCSGNVCKFTDATAPENSYVAYTAKVSGNYSFAFNKYYPCGSEDYNCYDTVFFTKENKFLNTDNAPNTATFPYSTLGNAITGPYQTGACPPATESPASDVPATPATPATPAVPINGGWSDWSAWGGCSASCNQTRTRICANPAPANGGADCSGSSTETRTCSGGACIPAPGNFNVFPGGPALPNSVFLSWTASDNATAYRILRGSPRVDITPYQSYPALNYSDTTVDQNTSYVYQIEAYNSAGTQRSNLINITTPFRSPTISLSAYPTSTYQNQIVTLTWTTTDATYCSASDAWSGSKPVNGSGIVHPASIPTTSYTLSCSGPGGTTVQSVAVNVTLLALPDWREIIPR
ncbi:MAG: hypothetical protein Q7S78_00185 [Candidatus Azambacteria bacterium]|nr:hypothetical protein [Candidatus Azambacteria bacterium]